MAVKIRLTRKGKKKQPSYRVVVADSRSPRDGRYIEQIGRYDPRQEPSLVEIDTDRASYWLERGAQPSDQVRKLLEIAGSLDARPAKVEIASDVHVVGEDAQLEAAAEDQDVIALAEEEATEATDAVAEAVEAGAEKVVDMVEDAVDAVAEEAGDESASGDDEADSDEEPS